MGTMAGTITKVQARRAATAADCSLILDNAHPAEAKRSSYECLPKTDALEVESRGKLI